MSKAAKTANGRAGEAEARRFLRLLFGRAPAEAYLLVWEKRGAEKVSTWFPSPRVDDAAAFAASRRGDVYFGVCLSPKDYGPRQRCPQNGALGLVGLWVDIDVAGEGHKKPNLPATFDEALDLAGTLGVAPSAVIDSGHGLHAYWLFDEPWVFSGPAEREEARALSERWQAALRRNAEARGWTIDSTHDLARILRVPGTVNRKGELVSVRLIEADDSIRYTPDDFLALLADDSPAEEPPSRPAASRAATAATAAEPLSIAERARRYVAKMPHSISGERGHDAAWLVAQALVRGFDLPEGEAWPILQDFNERCEPRWTEKELRHKLKDAREKSRLTAGYLLKRAAGAPSTSSPPSPATAEAAREPASAPAPAGAAPVRLGPLVLRPGQPNRTPTGRLSLSLAVHRDGAPIDALHLTSSGPSRKAVESRLCALLPDKAPERLEVADVIGQVLADADRTADQAARAPRDAEGAGLVPLFARLVPKHLGLVFVTEGGIWSERLKCVVAQAELRNWTPSWLLREALKVCPNRDGDELALTGKVQTALGVLFNDLRKPGKLPRELEADLGYESARAEQHRQMVKRLWMATDTWEQPHEGGPPPARTSLARRALVSSLGLTDKLKPGWRRIIGGCDAWWRLAPPGRQPRLLLAMRYSLCDQVRHGRLSLPGVTDEKSLTLLGERYGALDPHPPLWARTRSGGEPARLAVLAPKLTAELLDDPCESPDEDGSGVCAEDPAHTHGVCAQPSLRTQEPGEEG